MRAMKEHEREMDMIFPFSPVAWNLLFFCLFFFCLGKMWRYFTIFVFRPRASDILSTCQRWHQTWARRLDADKWQTNLSVGVWMMRNNPHFTKCARDEMKTAVIAAAGCCVHVDATAFELKVDKDWQLCWLESAGQFCSLIKHQNAKSDDKSNPSDC